MAPVRLVLTIRLTVWPGLYSRLSGISSRSLKRNSRPSNPSPRIVNR